jgi:hypothetical protein
MRSVMLLVASLLVLVNAESASAQAVAHLRTSCSGAPTPCFTTADSLASWISYTRLPSESSPLNVEIGPGEFPTGTGLSIICTATDGGYVTFRGAGRAQSRIVAAPGGFFKAAATFGFPGFGQCTEIAFQDVTLVGQRYGVIWFGGGRSFWTNMDIEAGMPGDNNIGWDESACSEENLGTHYFFNSRVHVRAQGNTNIGYISRCGETWFYGSEVDVVGQAGLAGNPTMAAVMVHEHGHFQAFGSLLRAQAGEAVPSSWNPDVPGLGLAAIRIARVSNGGLAAGGVFHAHGGNIVAKAGALSGANATSLDVGPDAMKVHTPGSAFVAEAGPSGISRRIFDGGAAPGVIESPYDWPASPVPPVGQSLHGSDVFVETDCGSDGNCNAACAGSETHIMVHNTALCGTGGWFDTTTGACRPSETTPCS